MFFAALHSNPANAARNLPQLVETFQARRYVQIDELKGWSTQEIQETFSIAEKGDANFIRMKLEAEIVRVDKETRRVKRARK